MKIINKNRQEKGITLIALVITVIVLLILAGVTIATLTGENGILTKAQSAKKLSNKAEVEEKIDLAVQASRMNTEGKIDSQKLKEELEKQGLTVENVTDETTGNLVAYKVSANGYIYKVDITTGVKEQITGVIIEAPENTNIFVGETINLTAKLVDMQGTITWESDNENVVVEATAENDKQATVTVNEGAIGTVTITAKIDENNFATCTLTVFSKVTSITVDNSALTIEPDDTAELVAIPEPSTNVEDLVFLSNNEKVIVEPNGIVGPDGSVKSKITVAPDAEVNSTAIITVQGKQTGNVEGKIATCTVTVIAPEVLGIGSYVKYDVTYTSMKSSPIQYDNTGKGKYGWRILDVGDYDEDTKTYSNTKIISTECPIFLKFNDEYIDWGPVTTSNGGQSGRLLKMGLLDRFNNMPLQLLAEGTNVNFGIGYCYNNIENNDRTEEYSSEKGTIFLTNKATKVSTLTLELLNRARYEDKNHDSDTTSTNQTDKNGLFKIKDRYFLADSCGSNGESRAPRQDRMRFVDSNGGVSYGNSYEAGVRPVITLKSGITITKGTNGAWDIN